MWRGRVQGVARRWEQTAGLIRGQRWSRAALMWGKEWEGPEMFWDP